MLAGKNGDAIKIRDAGKNNIEIINLRRLQKLLLRQLTVDSIKQLEKLTKDLFKAVAYEPAGAPLLEQIMPTVLC